VDMFNFLMKSMRHPVPVASTVTHRKRGEGSIQADHGSVAIVCGQPGSQFPASARGWDMQQQLLQRLSQNGQRLANHLLAMPQPVCEEGLITLQKRRATIGGQKKPTG